MSIFLLATFGIATAILVAMGVALARTRDSLHPIVVLGPMMLFLYVGMPMRLYWGDGFMGYLTGFQLATTQSINLTGVLALLVGVGFGAAGGRFQPGPPSIGADELRLRNAAVLIGILGVIGFALVIAGGGGLSAAYGRAYGRGSADSGYLRDLYHLTVPGILMMLAAGTKKPLGLGKLWVLLFASPFLLHGFLGARRGPTFLVLVAIVGGYYLVRNRRPSLPVVLGGGAALGALLLFLVANRSKIYIGSDLDFDRSPTEYIDAGGGNEFIYGAGAVLTAEATNAFTWGGRYATVLFIRPIPRVFWPSKYKDAEEWFGTNIEENMGVGTDALSYVMGWRGALGAAPGIIADMWIEFWWGMPIAMSVIGWIYGRTWRGMVTHGGFATIAYGALLCLSVYLIMQTLEAALFRGLFMLGPSWLAWRWALRPGSVLRST